MHSHTTALLSDTCQEPVEQRTICYFSHSDYTTTLLFRTFFLSQKLFVALIHNTQFHFDKFWSIVEIYYYNGRRRRCERVQMGDRIRKDMVSKNRKYKQFNGIAGFVTVSDGIIWWR